MVFLICCPCTCLRVLLALVLSLPDGGLDGSHVWLPLLQPNGSLLDLAFGSWLARRPRRLILQGSGRIGFHVLRKLFFFSHLRASLLPLCRSGSDSGLGRGQQRLVAVLCNLELASLHDRDPFSRNCTAALEVDPNRVSLPTVMGNFDPGLWIP